MVILEILSKKLIFARFFERVYKIKAVTVFLTLAILVLKYPLLDLNQFLSKEYLFDKNNLYLKNISQLIFLSSKIKLIFFIIITLDKIKYEFKNEVILKVPEKLIITMTNPLVCYLIIIVSYTKLLLITKLIFISFKFEFFEKISCIYNGPAKPNREIRSS